MGGALWGQVKSVKALGDGGLRSLEAAKGLGNAALNVGINKLGPQANDDQHKSRTPSKTRKKMAEAKRLEEGRKRKEEADRSRKMEIEADDLRKFERSFFISQLSEKDFEELLGFSWKTVRVRELDLSSEKYKLESLDGPPPDKGLLNPLFKRKWINIVNLSNNRLVDINGIHKSNGFESVKVLLARQNYINNPMLVLPTLLELNLAHNELTSMPNFSGTPQLEVLILAHNHLAGSFQGLRELRRLQRIDLAYNKYMFPPSEFAHCLEALRTLQNLTQLRIYNNPFVTFFQEYQVFVVHLLPSLTSLDYITISKSLREDIKSKKIYSRLATNRRRTRKVTSRKKRT